MTDKNCGNCKWGDVPEDTALCCQDDAEPCDYQSGLALWEPIEEEKNPFNHQVGGGHYKGREDVIDLAEFCIRHKVESAETNVMKYAFRHEKKNGLEDLRKAKQYLEFIAWVKYNTTL